ncbi:putative membrane protein [Trachipleistophora hominis]|uniref:Derlin n=1 Tax=Trachipleistophora hominis TaxID=72359 RepID=L7JS52_TRAHO|nr:putative membrane protein [Trachipleistophora hominis]
MLQLETVPPVVLAILLCASVIPLLGLLSPQFTMYFVYDKSYLKRFEIWRLFTGIFVTGVSISLIMRLYFIHKFSSLILEYNCRIDHVPTEIELAFFMFTMFVPLMIGNQLEGINTFSECIPIALIRYFSELVPDNFRLNFFGTIMSAKTYSIVSLAIDYVLNGGRSKVYYGFLHALIYVYLRKKVLRVPAVFVEMIERAKRIKLERLFRTPEVGRRLGGEKKNKKKD